MGPKLRNNPKCFFIGSRILLDSLLAFPLYCSREQRLRKKLRFFLFLGRFEVVQGMDTGEYLQEPRDGRKPKI
jgi:hypothetical protein